MASQLLTKLLSNVKRDIGIVYGLVKVEYPESSTYRESLDKAYHIIKEVQDSLK